MPNCRARITSRTRPRSLLATNAAPTIEALRSSERLASGVERAGDAGVAGEGAGVRWPGGWRCLPEGEVRDAVRLTDRPSLRHVDTSGKMPRLHSPRGPSDG